MENDFNKKLELFRTEIDETDKAILNLLNKRAKIVLKIKKLKTEHNAPFYDAKREEILLNNIIKCNNGPLLNDNVIHIFESILKNMQILKKDYA